jgi:hypothetical protein
MGTIGYIVMAISYMAMVIWPLVTWILAIGRLLINGYDYWLSLKLRFRH